MLSCRPRMALRRFFSTARLHVTRSSSSTTVACPGNTCVTRALRDGSTPPNRAGTKSQVISRNVGISASGNPAGASLPRLTASGSHATGTSCWASIATWNSASISASCWQGCKTRGYLSAGPMMPSAWDYQVITASSPVRSSTETSGSCANRSLCS